MHVDNRRPLRRAQGLTLVELMIAMVLGSLVLVAVTSVYLASTQSFRTQEGLARLQEGARFAFETIGFDFRQAGFGCASVGSGTVIKTAADVGGWWYMNLFRAPLWGFENGTDKDGATSPYAADTVAGTDSLWALRADKTEETFITASGTTNADHGLSANGLAVITGDAYTDGTVYVLASGSTGNTFNLGTATSCTGTDVPGDVGNRFLPLAAHFYYIRNNPAGEPSLYRETLTSAGVVQPQELVEGVENMQILYGEDTTQVTDPECPDDGCSVDNYVAADAVTDWNRVVSVRITLTMRTADGLSADTSGADRRIRRTFTTTIAMRNRL